LENSSVRFVWSLRALRIPTAPFCKATTSLDTLGIVDPLIEGDEREGGSNSVGGADGIRTHDLLDAIEARSQLRHGPTLMGIVTYL
jgi:hypothetical protein